MKKRNVLIVRNDFEHIYKIDTITVQYQSLVYSMGLVCLHTDMPTLNAHWTKLLAIVKFMRGYSLVP